VYLLVAKAWQVMELKLIHSLAILVVQCLVLVMLDSVAVVVEWEVDSVAVVVEWEVD
jgi:hypothetical protein